MKKSNKFLTTLCFIFISVLFLPNIVLAKPYTLKVDGNTNLYVEHGTKINPKGTAKYDAESKTLTLNNYDGNFISTDIDDLLTINLIGTNKVHIGPRDTGIKTESNLIITGDGTLEITGGENGIYVSDGNLEVKDTTLKISDFKNDGIYTSGNATFSSDVTIKGTGEALYIDGLFNMQTGNISIDAENLGIFTGNFSMKTGNLKINVPKGEDLIGGLLSMSNIEIDDGYVEIKTKEGGFAIAAASIYDENPSFTIGENLMIIPKEDSIESTTLNLFDDLEVSILTVGLEGLSTTLDPRTSEIKLSKVANEVIIKEKEVEEKKEEEIEEEIIEENPKTGDNIYLYTVLGFCSLLFIAFISISLKNEIRS